MSTPIQSDAPPARRAQWALAALFCTIPIFAVGGGLALAPLLALAGLVAFPLRLPPWTKAAPLALAAFALWAAATAMWSPGRGGEQAAKLLATLLVGLSLTFAAAGLPATRRPIVRASVLAGMSVLALLLGVEALFDMPFNRAAQPEALTGLLLRNPGRGVLVLDVFGFAALAAALMSRNSAVRFGLSAALVLAMALLSLQFEMSANAAAFLLGAGLFLVAYAAPRIGLALVGGGAALWLLIAPWTMLLGRGALTALEQKLPVSWGMRLEIWSYAAQRISEKPALGWGLDSARTFDEERRFHGFSYQAIPLHPHSVSLQIWLETGAIGAVLGALAILLCTRAAVRRFGDDRLAAAAACGGGGAMWLAWNCSYGAWQEWFLALPFILSAAALALRRADKAAP